MKLLTYILGIVILSSVLLAVEADTRLMALRTDTAPRIDAVLDEEIWQRAEVATDFATLFPKNHLDARLGNRVQFAYDDANLYIAAELEAASPDSIMAQLGERDNEEVAADWFGVWISPYNDKANDIVFRVTSAGVQLDHKSGPNYGDFSWDPVWDSEVRIHEKGWTVEFAIPFSQIRFPASDKQVWGVNIARWVQSTREVFTWTFIEKDHPNWSAFEGELHGIENIQVPLRLSFTPYAATSFSHFPFDEPGKSNWSKSIRGGMDLKYGINESFTLDLTLIPDFGEVQSDNVVVNFTPFEIRHDERRPFFTEGVDLLRKAGRFYSRRVGARPLRYWDVYDLVEDDSLVIENPEESQMINATKITGQTGSGIGLAFFNALTAPMYARYQDTLGVEHDYMTAPLTNFNRVVVNKNFGSGSEFGISNSYVWRGDDSEDSEFKNEFRDANVTGFSSRLAFNESQYIAELNGSYSQIMQGDSTETGHEWGIHLKEVDGSFRMGAILNVESDSYDPNDLGFMFNNNEFTQVVWVELIKHEPGKLLHDGRVEFNFVNEHLYEPREWVESILDVNWNMTFKNFMSQGGGIFVRPAYERNFYEARTDGQVFLVPPRAHIHAWLSSDFNKPVSANGWLGIDNKDKSGRQWYGGGYNPRWRVNDQLFLRLEGDIHRTDKEHGFAEFDDDDNPVFGRRTRREITHILETRYTVSKSLSTSLRARHYWSQVVYDKFFDINPDGSLTERHYHPEDLDGVFNAFNIDAVLIWRFAPGSELNLIWKNAITEWSEGEHTHQYIGGQHADYLNDLVNILSEDQTNTISLKLLYYVDWWTLRNRLAK